MKRAAIYVYEDKNGVIGDYALFFLKSLLEVADEIIFVANGKINDCEFDKIQNSRIQILEKDDRECFLSAYRDGFSGIGNEKIKNFDELIFANSDTFGPVYPFSEMFREMVNKDVDFWGITRQFYKSKGVFKNTVKEYIEPYFLVFRQKMFLSRCFKKYVNGLKKFRTEKCITGHVEALFTEYFTDRGYLFDTFVDETVLDYGTELDSAYVADILIKNYRVPLIKKSVFYEPACIGRDGAVSSYRFIRENTEYDSNLIAKELAQYLPMDKIKNKLHLNFTLQTSCRENFLKGRCAVITEPLGSDFKYVENHLADFSGLMDIFSISPIKKTSLKITPLDCAVSIFDQIKRLTKRYGYFLIFLPNQLKLRNLEPVVKADYYRHVLTSLLSSKIYLSNIANTFEKNPDLGVLIPVPFIFRGKNADRVKEKEIGVFCANGNLNFPVNPNFLNSIPNCFWITKALIQKIDEIIDFEGNTPLNLGMIFSLYAQKYGYFTGTVSTPDIMARYVEILEDNCSATKSIGNF